MIVGDLDIPAEQWTNTFLPSAATSSMMLAANSIDSDIDADGESTIEIRWYVTPSIFSDGVDPMLMTEVTLLLCRNDEDDAAEHGPRKRKGGNTSTAAVALLWPPFCDLDPLRPAMLCAQCFQLMKKF
ncbi:hypothetical protein NW759_010352 [Fusarium solani]|nr:hypothetical protein NW759_010352 [Fusarium solani]